MLATLCVTLCLAAPVPEKKPVLALTATLDKKEYKRGDTVKLTFELKNVSKADIWIGEGFLAPNSNEIGPGRHFELHMRDEDETRFRYWGPVSTEGGSMGIRRVFRLKPDEVYKGGFEVTAGGFATIKTDKRHKLGIDSANYTMKLVYQVNPKSHGVWMPPKDFDPELLWQGTLESNELELKFK